ncbi:MAG TPA: hypothetical protein VGB57_12800 [Allosphingosinicella sp.]|jgi:hypothetical protein
MAITTIADIMTWLLAAWLFLAMGIILFHMLSGHIILTGLLKLEPRAPFGFDRLQLVAVTLLFAAGYVVAALYRGPGDTLPDIPTPLLLILIGSNGTYLAVKATTIGRISKRGK